MLIQDNDCLPIVSLGRTIHNALYDAAIIVPLYNDGVSLIHVGYVPL